MRLLPARYAPEYSTSEAVDQKNRRCWALANTGPSSLRMAWSSGLGRVERSGVSIDAVLCQPSVDGFRQLLAIGLGQAVGEVAGLCSRGRLTAQELENRARL